MAGPIIARDLQQTLRKAFEDAAKLRHEYVTLEHLLLALLDDPKAGAALDAVGANKKRLRKALLQFLDETMEKLPEGTEVQPQQTIGVERVLQRAAIHAISSEMKQIDGANVLVQLFKEHDSHAVYVLEKEGIQSFDLKQYVSHGITPDHVEGREDEEREGAGDAQTDAEEEEEEGAGAIKKDPLEAYTMNLSKE